MSEITTKQAEIQQTIENSLDLITNSIDELRKNNPDGAIVNNFIGIASCDNGDGTHNSMTVMNGSIASLAAVLHRQMQRDANLALAVRVALRSYDSEGEEE